MNEMKRGDEPLSKVGPKIKGLPRGDEPLVQKRSSLPRGDEPLGKKGKKIPGLPSGDEPLKTETTCAGVGPMGGSGPAFAGDPEEKKSVEEMAVRLLVRQKIAEVVRKKKGGGGFVLYAPNKGKKKNPKPVASFPTKLAAKRAELARFPPKDPKKLLRLRKEVEKLMKDPKKRAEAELRAQKQKGTDTGGTPKPKKQRKGQIKAKKIFTKREHIETMKHMIEQAAISAIIIQELRSLKIKEHVTVDNHWDLFIKKIAEKVAGKPFLEQRVDEMIGAMGPMQLKMVRRIMGSKYRKLI